MTILAIDPGTRQSGWVEFSDGKVLRSGVTENEAMLVQLIGYNLGTTLAIEMMRARGMPVSNDEMETLVWIGRFQQQWHTPRAVRLVYRGDVKMRVCGSMKAKDANIRQALIDMLGPPGTKKAPGSTYGVTSHAWAALAVAVTADVDSALRALAVTQEGT